MPLVQRVIQPTDLVRSPLHEALKGNDELQSVNMNALVGVLRQLASLSKHAETLFADLFNEASHTMSKAQGMENRVQCLAEKISTMNVVSPGNNALTDAPLHYTSQHQVDQNVVSQHNRTQCIRERQAVADLPPNLTLITSLRSDGKDSLAMYTNPDFFRNNWIRKMREEMVKEKKDKTRRRKRGQSLKKEAPRPVVKKEYYLDSLGNDVKIREKMIGRSVDQYAVQGQAIVEGGEEEQGAYPQYDQEYHQDEILYEETDQLLPPPGDFDLPPPPAFDDGFGADGFDLPPPQDMGYPQYPVQEPLYAEPEPSPIKAPPAPPAPNAPRAPPAPNAPPAPPPPGPPRAGPPKAISPVERQLTPVKQVSPSPPPANNFLNSIQNYKTSALRKVEAPKPKEETQYASMDVMSILSRRQVIQLSESEGESDSSEFNQDWED